MSKSNFILNPKKLSELSGIKELQNESLTNSEEQSQKLLLRKKNRSGGSNLDSPGMKEKVLIGLNNGRWNNEEHRAFIEGIFKYSNDWKKITDDIKTRNCPQARSHSQKFFAKLNKYITKSNENYYVDLKKTFMHGKKIPQEKKDAIVEMLIFAHDHLDNVLNCELLNHGLLADFLESAKKTKHPKDKDKKLTSESDNNRKFHKNKIKQKNINESKAEDCDFDEIAGDFQVDVKSRNIKKQNFESIEKNKNSKIRIFNKNDNDNQNDYYNHLSNNLSGSTNIHDVDNMLKNHEERSYLNVNNKVNYNSNNTSYFSNAYVNNNLSSYSNNPNNGYTSNNTNYNYLYNFNNNNDNFNYNYNYNPFLNQNKYNYVIYNKNKKCNGCSQEQREQESKQNQMTKNILNQQDYEQLNCLNPLNSLGLRANNNQNSNKTLLTLNDNNNNPEVNKASYYKLKKNSFTRETDSDDYDLNTVSGSFKKNSTKADLPSLQQNTNSNSNGNFYENESQINFNNLNLTTLKDSTEEAKTKTDRRGESKNTEKASFRESSMNHDFVVPQPIKNNISNLIQINSEFAKTFSQEIEKDNFFKKHSLEVKYSSSPRMSKSYSNALFTSENNTNTNNNCCNYNHSTNNQTIEEYNNYDDNPMAKISAYDYNNFYFNRCLEYLKKNSRNGKTDLIQEIKKCFIFPKKLLIENNNCYCYKCIAENSDRTTEYNNDSISERDKKCINNQFYYCEFDDISFISNHEKHCYLNGVKKDLNFDSINHE